MWFNHYWWIIIPGIAWGLYAQIKLSATYNRYVRVPTSRGLTGAEAARTILDADGLDNVPVNEVGGHLTDHYDPVKKELFLSSENFHGNSVAAVGVAAHESGHALVACSLPNTDPVHKISIVGRGFGVGLCALVGGGWRSKLYCGMEKNAGFGLARRAVHDVQLVHFQ